MDSLNSLLARVDRWFPEESDQLVRTKFYRDGSPESHKRDRNPVFMTAVKFLAYPAKMKIEFAMSDGLLHQLEVLGSPVDPKEAEYGVVTKYFETHPSDMNVLVYQVYPERARLAYDFQMRDGGDFTKRDLGGMNKTLMSPIRPLEERTVEFFSRKLNYKLPQLREAYSFQVSEQDLTYLFASVRDYFEYLDMEVLQMPTPIGTNYVAISREEKLFYADYDRMSRSMLITGNSLDIKPKEMQDILQPLGIRLE